ncbi:hypothetical protein N7452_006348 [Penicillium brevicompactum]|uniref:Aminoglycoside phosphotransferase domain-containing protein n=1 Tax=Penicillium brevicompactum TaxID=5074 RepID=A0A9W9UHF8_PENBR|nr:hypothetical protein N7452_006348 [Penicillium brevicompactum]
MPPILKGRLMFFDETAWDRADDLLQGWKNKLFTTESIQRITDLLSHKASPPYRLFPPQKGSFNMVIRLQFTDTTSSIIRFPIPGYSIFPKEKVAAEVAVMRFLQNTSIRVPQIHIVDSDPILGPYIIMEYIEHDSDLVDALNTPTIPMTDRPILDPAIDESRLRYVYGQMGDLLLELTKHEFPSIGSLTQYQDEWVIKDRPLSINMNELVQVGCVDPDDLPHGPFESGAGYIATLAELHMTHLSAQRNDAIEDAEDCRIKYIARCLFRRLAREKRLTNPAFEGSFRLFCDDLRPANVLACKDSIAAAIDWEFTYAAPLGFVYAPPCWLLLERPEYWEAGIDDWECAYAKRLEVFLEELEEREEEKIREGLLREDKRLAGYMRKSWETGDFWVSYAARRSWAFDIVYWARIDRRFFGEGDLEDRVALLTQEERDGMDVFVSRKLHEMEIGGLKSRYGSPTE